MPGRTDPTVLKEASDRNTGGPIPRHRLPLSVVAKPTGAACNLDCQYCFFLSKEKLYNVPRQLMSEETADVYIREYLAASPDGDVTMLWQGGEPTLRGLPFFKTVIELCERHRRPAQRVHHALQTNATLIDADWARFLAEHDVLVGVSIDGPPELHDAYRVNRGGRGTYSMVLRGWEHLQHAGVRCNILCTVHAANQEHPLSVYRHFRDQLGARYLQFIPIVERATEQNREAAEAGWRDRSGVRVLYTQEGEYITSRSVDPQGYGRFLFAVFEEWIKHDIGEVYVQDFDAVLSALFGQYTVCVHAPGCGINVAMEFNGDVYACDHWVEPQWKLGNIADSSFAALAQTQVMREFSRKKSDQLSEQCRRCPVVRLCHGGCPKDRFVRAEGGEQNYLCPGYFHFFSRALPDFLSMARLLRSGRAPAELRDPALRAAMRVSMSASQSGEGRL